MLMGAMDVKALRKYVDGIDIWFIFRFVSIVVELVEHWQR